MKMLLIFGGRSAIGQELVKNCKQRGEKYISIGRVKGEICQQAGDLCEPESINLTEDALDTTRIIFCQRYRPAKNDVYSMFEDMQISVKGPLTFCRRVVEKFPNLTNIVFISSGAAEFISDEQPIEYHIVRAGLESMARYLAYEFSPKGVAVNAIRIGYVKGQRKQTRDDSTFYNVDQYVVPSGGAPNAAEVADAIDKVSHLNDCMITGQTINVDAGITLRTHASLAYSIVKKMNQ